MRHVILHHHIFKNAGSTLDAALAAQFHSNFTEVENGGALVCGAQVRDTLLHAPSVQALSSHHFSGQSYETILAELGIRAFHLALVRKPWDRIISAYNFLAASDHDDEAAQIAKHSEVVQYVHHILNYRPQEVNSPQVNIIANHGFYGRPISDQDLETAWSRYQRFSLCAPTERYDEAMVTLEYFNSPVYRPDGLKLHYTRRNVSPPKASLADLREALSSQEIGLIDEMVKYDEELWRRSNRELDRRISLVPHFLERLGEFRERCARLHRSTN